MPLLNLTNVSKELNDIRHLVTAYLNVDDAEGNHSHISEDDIRQCVQRLASFAPSATEDQLDRTVRTLCEEWGIIDLGDEEPGEDGTLIADHEEWLEKALREGDIKWRRWNAYKKLLRKQGRSHQVISDLDDATNTILDLAGNPHEEGLWTRKGLAIGDVQSGKTQTFLAVANKAADAGYKVIIILAGNTEYLRKQTQERVDSDFIGRDGSKLLKKVNSSASTSNRIGIGLIDKTLHANGMTTPFYDYLQLKNEGHNLALVTKESENPYIFVVKKNSYVLEAVDQWSKHQADGAGFVDAAALIIDDESDYASVDTSVEGNDPTKINSAIRRILDRYARSSYLAVTATPFANIFINHEGYGDVGKKPKKSKAIPVPEAEILETKDLFPENYIHALKAPINYVGLKRTFGTYDEPVVDKLNDNSDCESIIPLKHTKDREIEVLPESLEDAIETYVIANAIFDLRGRAKDARSMLINVSKFTEVQNRLAFLVKENLARIQNALESFGGIASSGQSGQILGRLKNVFESEFSDCGSSWEEVLIVLPDSAASIRVKVYNSKPTKLGEDEAFEAGVPSRQIAIGGDLLSRGLTLNNLLTSYFYRNPMAADTMMQMARWFGYRDGYFDLVRLWLPNEKTNDYQFIEQAVRQLKRQIKRMSEQGLTPLDFGLAVQQHPESLLITARNKSRSATSAPSTIDLTHYLLETTKISSDLDSLRSNEQATEQLVAATGVSETSISESTSVVSRVDKKHIANFLDQYKFSPMERLFDSEALAALVRGSSSDEYTHWDVVFIAGKKGNERWTLPSGLALPRLVTRALLPRDGYFAVSGKSSRLAGSTDLHHVLSSKNLAAIKSIDGKLPTNEAFYYQYVDRPALIIYALEPKQRVKTSQRKDAKLASKDIDDVASVVAVKLALPRMKKISTRTGRDGVATYLHNSVAARAWKAQYAAFEGNE